MKYSDFILKSKDVVEVKEVKRTSVTEATDPAKLLRGAGFKIKLVTPTSFGTQITLSKKYKKEEIESILSSFSIKWSGDKDIFVIS